MQPITQVTNRSQRESRTLSFTPSPSLLIVLVLVTGFIILNIGARALAQSTMPPSNPFTSFADIFPGTPSSILQTHGFSCAIVPYGDNPNEYCYLYPVNDIFSQVSALVSEGLIHTISFSLRENVLSIGDLMVLWGTPDVRGHSHTAHFFSNNINFTAFPVESSSQFSLFLPVQRVISQISRCNRYPPPRHPHGDRFSAHSKKISMCVLKRAVDKRSICPLPGFQRK